ncbi:MAG: AAA family ATPase [Ignavibacteriales bacterium]|nr:MAG: AAA family ATPase [Ignavibacteriales bacterium]
MIGQVERVVELNNLKNGKNKKTAVKTIAFTSGKGGTGKTFLAVNMAYAISELNKKVLLVDLDSNLSNVNILLNMNSKKTLNEFFTGRKLLPELITPFENNLHIIFGDSGKLDYDIPKPEMVKLLFSHLSKVSADYDYIFLDTGAGAHDDTINFLLHSSLNVIVTTPEPTSVMDAYVMVKLLKSNGYAHKNIVIVNKCSTDEEGAMAFNNLNVASKHFLSEDLHLLGFVLLDSLVRKSIIDQEVLLKNYQNTKSAGQVRKLSQGLIEFIQLANINQSKVSAYQHNR